MNQLLRTALLILLAGLTWLAWQKPAPAPDHATLHAKLPEIPAMADHRLWRVVTNRIVSRPASNTLAYRLRKLGLKPLRIEHREEVTLHTFDDATLFKARSAAAAAAGKWRDSGIEATVTETGKNLWRIGLGRLYQPKYAEIKEAELRKNGREFRYQQRLVTITAWRFTFAATSRSNADHLWKQLRKTGLMNPILISETDFQNLYDDATIRPALARRK